MEDEITSCNGAGERFRIPKVTDNAFDLELAHLARETAQGPYAIPALEQHVSHVPA